MVDVMTTREEALKRIAALCEEAIRLNGTNWSGVQAHIEAALATMPLPDREQLDRASQDPSPAVRPLSGRARH